MKIEPNNSKTYSSGGIRQFDYLCTVCCEHIISSCLPCLEFVQPERLERPLLLPCIENSHVITVYPVLLVSFYSAAVHISSVHNLKDRSRREGERLTHKSS